MSLRSCEHGRPCAALLVDQTKLSDSKQDEYAGPFPSRR